MNLNFDNIYITSYAELLTYMDEEDIMHHFYGDYEINIKGFCPFKKERTPSFLISYKEDKLVWQRFGMYDKRQGVMDFVMIKFNLNFFDALNLCYKEIYLKENKMDASKISTMRSYAHRGALKGSIKTREYQDYDLSYWGEYYFDKAHLLKWKIYSAELYKSTDKGSGHKVIRHVANSQDPLFCYKHDKVDGKYGFTAYRPLAKDKKNKFRKFDIAGHIMGWEELPLTGDKVFITSSLKDIATFDLINIPSVAPHTERSFLPEDKLIELKVRFNHVYVAYDNDSTGVERSLELTKKYDLKYWNVPKACIDCKDPSGLSKNYSLEYLSNNVDEKFKRDGTF